MKKYYPKTSELIDYDSLHVKSLFKDSFEGDEIVNFVLKEGLYGLLKVTLCLIRADKVSIKKSGSLSSTKYSLQQILSPGFRFGKNLRSSRLIRLPLFLRKIIEFESILEPTSIEIKVDVVVKGRDDKDSGEWSGGRLINVVGVKDILKDYLGSQYQGLPLLQKYESCTDGYGWETYENYKAESESVWLIEGGGRIIVLFCIEKWERSSGDGRNWFGVVEGGRFEGFKWKNPPSNDEDDDDTPQAPETYQTVTPDYLMFASDPGGAEGAMRFDKEFEKIWTADCDMYGWKGKGEWKIDAIEVYGFGRLF